jgi:hypothetical protein
MKMSRIAVVSALLLASLSALADVKISALPAGSALGGTEPVPAVQGGNTVRTTPAAISTYTIGALSSANVIGKWTGTCDVTTFLRGDGTCAAAGVTPAALTKVDDTNVTLTLGGSPSTALVNAASITAGWTGQLSVARGGTGLATAVDDNMMVGNGTTWQSKALTSCSAADSALTYNTTTNAFGCNTISGGSGTVTSVGLTMPTGLSVGGSPVTSSGTLAVTTTLSGVVHGNGSGFTAGNVALGSEVSGTLPVGNGGLGITTVTDDTIPVANGTGYASTAIPNCGSSTQALAYNTSTNAFSCQTITGAAGNPAGSNTQIQYNNSGVFGADANFTWDSGNRFLTLGASATNSKITLGATATNNTTIQQLDLSSGNVGTLNILGGASTTGLGGTVNIKGGQTGNGSGAGGSVILLGGIGGATSGTGGSITIQGGVAATNGNGGPVAVNGGDGQSAASNADGGAITFTGGAGIRLGAGGATTVAGGTSGASAAAVGGNLTLNAGRGGGASSVGGALILQTAPNNSQVERLRILNNGAWSVGTGGAATGTSGQVLTSTGSTTAPTWQDLTLAGTSPSIGGGALVAGACASNTVTVTGATTGMAVSASPVTYPGDGNYWLAYVSASNTVTVKVCAAVAGTPTASTYNVRVIR